MKDLLLAELDARIARHGSGDSSGVLDERALALVTELAASGDPDAGSLGRVAALHLCRYQALPPEDGADDLRLAMDLYRILHSVDARLVPPEARALLGFASPREAGIALLREYERGGPVEHLERAVSLLRQEADQPDDLHSLAVALVHRFERFGQRADLDEAIGRSRYAVAVAGPDDPRRAGFQSALAESLLRRFELTANPSDVEEAIAVGRELVATTGGPSRAQAKARLARALTRRSEQT